MKKIVVVLSFIVALGLFTSCERPQGATEKKVEAKVAPTEQVAKVALPTEKKVEPAQVRWKVYFSDGSHAEVMARDSTEAIQEGIKLSELVIQVEKVGGNEVEESKTYAKERERAERERAERERIAQKGGWINFATAESEYVGVPNQKVWYNSDTITLHSPSSVTFVHIVRCNKQPRNSGFSGSWPPPEGILTNPMVELKDGTVVKGDWVAFLKAKWDGREFIPCDFFHISSPCIWTWSISDSVYTADVGPNPIQEGSVIDVLFQVLSKQPRLGAKKIVK